WRGAEGDGEGVGARIAAWDAVYTKDSVAAALYESWRGASDTGGRGRRGGPPPTRDETEKRIRSLLQANGALDRRWGQQHGRAFAHLLLRGFDLPRVERSGGAGTLEADGATYREILDVANWDRSLAINVPGQSGQPTSAYYGNLLNMWADNEYFPLAFSRAAVNAAAAHRLRVLPR